MGNDLNVGAVVLEYASRIGAIMSQVADASTASEAAAAAVNGENSYIGEAAPEMKEFFSNYNANVNKLAYFLSVSTGFLKRAFDEFGFTEAELAQMALILQQREAEKQ